MPVTPYRASLLQNRQDLYQLLLTYQQSIQPQDQKTIISISQEIPFVDPIVALHAIAQTNQLSFYIEKSNQKQAIAATGAAISLQVEGPHRFLRAQNFIADWQDKITTLGTLHLPLSGPHFFCNLTFFDRPSKLNSPFPSATIFLPQWQISRYQDHCVVVANIVLEPDTDIDVLYQKVWREFQTIQLASYSPFSLNLIHPTQRDFKKRDVASQEAFKSAVASALKSIQANQIQKIVLAHAVDVTSPVPFNLTQSLVNLRQIYPDCYVFLTSDGNGHSFIGASPERLVQLHNHELATDALAGSAPRGKTAAEDASLANRLLNSEKESREHQVVIDFITQRLADLGLTPQRSPSPRLLQLSNIQHLQTSIQAKVPADVHLLEILAALHPTPAVAGVPREITCQQIRRYETFERSLYAAPLGWVDHQGNGEFIVGIRSALINGCQARLYAGAGIVAGSDPDKEFAEIQLKLQALLAALA